MKDWVSCSSGKSSGSRFPLEPFAETNHYRITDDSSMSKASSLSSKKSKSSKFSKQSRNSTTNKDDRDDNSGRFSMNAATNKREDDDVLVSLPASMVESPSVYSKLSAAASRISQSRSEATPIPRDLVIESRKSNSSQSRKSMLSRVSSKSTSSTKSTKSNITRTSSRKDEEEVMAQQQRLKDLELQLNERKRELKRQKEEREREINSKLEAIRMSEEERLRKEREIEQKVKYLAQKEQEIFERLAAIEAASVARREKEREVEAKVVNLAQREKEIEDKLAAIDAASVARRKKEREIEDKIMDFVQREQKFDERFVLIESTSVLEDNEIGMEEKLRLKELDKKGLLIKEKNNALEEAMQLDIQRENEIRERMAILDASANALLERANAVLMGQKNGGLKKKLESVFRKKKTSPGQRSKGYHVAFEM